VVLVDTSVWIEVFRKKNPLDLESLVDFAEVVTCLPIVQEVLQGFRDERAYRVAREAMLALPTVDVPVDRELFESAIALCRAARRRGLTVRSSVGCLIAASALRHDLRVLHHDRDFTLLAKIAPLRTSSMPI
jgi:predicted nucleic acid-binding protein